MHEIMSAISDCERNVSYERVDCGVPTGAEKLDGVSEDIVEALHLQAEQLWTQEKDDILAFIDAQACSSVETSNL